MTKLEAHQGRHTGKKNSQRIGEMYAFLSQLGREMANQAVGMKAQILQYVFFDMLL